jgi:hypothetical protein
MELDEKNGYTGSPPKQVGRSEVVDAVPVIYDDDNLAGQQILVKNSFTFINVFSLAFSCINSWVVLVVGLGAGLSSGGPTACEYDGV